MGGKELKQASERIAEKRKLLKTPVAMLPDDPENIKLSKAEFIAKRRNKKEEDVAVEKFKKDFRAGKVKQEEGVKEDVPQEPEEEVEVKPKRGKPKRIED